MFDFLRHGCSNSPTTAIHAEQMRKKTANLSLALLQGIRFACLRVVPSAIFFLRIWSSCARRSQRPSVCCTCGTRTGRMSDLQCKRQLQGKTSAKFLLGRPIACLACFTDKPERSICLFRSYLLDWDLSSWVAPFVGCLQLMGSLHTEPPAQTTHEGEVG